MKADVAATLEAYRVDVSSDLDKILNSAVGNLVKKETANSQAALKKETSDRLQGPLAQTRGSLAGLDRIAAELANRLNIAGNLLKELKLKI